MNPKSCLLLLLRDTMLKRVSIILTGVALRHSIRAHASHPPLTSRVSAIHYGLIMDGQRPMKISAYLHVAMSASARRSYVHLDQFYRRVIFFFFFWYC